MECHALHADLHKLGGIEVLLDSLGEHNSKALRAAGANALGVAASNNEEFVQRLWDMCGPDILDKLMQVCSRPSKKRIMHSSWQDHADFMHPVTCLTTETSAGQFT